MTKGMLGGGPSSEDNGKALDDLYVSSFFRLIRSHLMEENSA